MSHQVIIIGPGPAGLTAAIYTARANLKPLVIAGLKYGGQLMDTTEVENYPGFPDGVQGPELIAQMIAQAKRFGADFVYKEATKVDLSGETKKVYVGDTEYTANAVIVATGAKPRMLGLESEWKYWGKGVSSCATCDGAFYREKIVAVVGGGDSAAEEALFLTRFASRVHLIVRRDEMRASKIMQERVAQNEKIEMHWNSEVLEVLGDEKVVIGLKLKDNKANTESVLELQGMFLAIGHDPNTKLFEGVLDANEIGYLELKEFTHPNIEGVFIAGDNHDHRYRQAITAAGEGCKAAIDVERWLEEVGK
jgi:thioredoxin reductase (NADPH)